MTPWEYNYIKWLAFHFPERYLQLSGEGVTINLFSGLPRAAFQAHIFLLNVQIKFLLFPHIIIFFPWLQPYRCTEFKEGRKILQDTSHTQKKKTQKQTQQKPTNPNQQLYLNCTGKSNVFFCLELDSFPSVYFCLSHHSDCICFMNVLLKHKKNKMLERFFEVFLPGSSKFQGWRHNHRTIQSPKACCDKKVSKASGLTQQSKVAQRSCIQKRSALQDGSEARGSKEKRQILYCTPKLPSQRFPNLR